jgi:preprotein translocase subunit Sss1
MDNEKKKDNTGKNLSEFKNRLKLLEFLAFVESVRRFELTNGRKPTWDERKNIATASHINLDDFCALIQRIYSDKFPIASEKG